MLSAITCVLLACGWPQGEPDHAGQPAVGPHSHSAPTPPTHRGVHHETTLDSRRFSTSRDSSVVLPLPVDSNAFQFVVFGDRTGGTRAGLSTLRRAVVEANLLQPDLVMTVGDLIQGYAGIETWLAEAAEYKQIMRDLRMPWFPVAGNHDVYWRGPDKPPDEHEGRYEQHFGPLWYAFEHKECWFVVLYTDEPNPRTGERDFNKPECQRMSPEQLAWLRETLAKTASAPHVFVFVHHPRWQPQYGDDWEKVHAELVRAGNVTAVFAGHIHHMRYSGERDGIEYLTLATVGAHQWGRIPDAGFLHEIHVVTVRGDGIGLAALPVGEIVDPRLVTDAIVEQSLAFAREAEVTVRTELSFDAEFAADATVHVEFSNPTALAVEFALLPSSADPRWRFTPDHHHVTLGPGVRGAAEFRATHPPDGGVDAALATPFVAVHADLLGDGLRVQLPRVLRDVTVGLPPTLPASIADRGNSIALDGFDDCVILTSIEARPIRTLEFWMHAHRFRPSVGVLSSIARGGVALRLDRGTPVLQVGAGPSTSKASSDLGALEPAQWHHLAVVVDGPRVRLFVDGEPACEIEHPPGVVSLLPCAIGATIDPFGVTSDHFVGRIDEVRGSTSARYSDPFGPDRRLLVDETTALLLHCDSVFGNLLRDAADPAGIAILRGRPMIGASPAN